MKKILGFALATLVSTSCLADGNKDGFYFGLNAGKTSVEAGWFDESDTSYGLFLGYRFMPYVGLELGATQFGEPTAEDSGARGTVDAYGLDLSVLGLYPISDSFDIFAKIGAMQWDVTLESKISASGSGFTTLPSHTDRDKDSGTSLAFGAGAIYMPTSWFGMRAEIEMFDADHEEVDVDLQTTSLSVFFQF